ncbi:MAG TPA: SRPBCC family protein [Gammaproteobacteria bacterium]|jgi:uncharacterized protein YndB with AHSA1/START domain|nr:SRPBCC family protein [Gammaproteobacteria bacterium]
MKQSREQNDQVQISVVVAISQERAFDFYTRRFDVWWPRDAHIGKAPMRTAVLEPRVGGRLYERDADGTECDWGRLLTWEPPQRVKFSWHIDHVQQFDPDPDHASDVEVRFIPEGPKQTRVELTHSNFGRHGIGAGSIRESISKGWPKMLGEFAAKCAGSADSF